MRSQRSRLGSPGGLSGPEANEAKMDSTAASPATDPILGQSTFSHRD